MDKTNLPQVAVPARLGVSSGISQAASQRWNPDLRASAEDSEAARSISILDPIGADMWGDGVTAKRIGGALRAIGGGDVVVNINSPGGDYFEGLAIYNQLREYEGHVTVRVLGLAASAASIIAMAADEVQIGRAAFLMIHNTWVVAAGDRNAFRDVADWLEPFDRAAADVYAARTGLDTANVSAMLDRETWISGQKAIDQGFADSLLASDAEGQADAKNAATLSPLAAAKKLDILLADKTSRSERQALVAALKSGMPGAAQTGKLGAAETDLALAAEALLGTLKAI
ncbi:MAG: head maturation protease, ClpP-related [Pseudomonadota bacterium]